MLIDVVIRNVTINQAGFGAWGVLVTTTRTLIDVILDLFDYYLHQNYFVVTNSVNDAASLLRKSYDIRTARRIRGGERALEFAITANSGSAGAVEWSVNTRLLLKL